MVHKTDSADCANELINWLREYASKRIDSRLIDERRCFPPHIFLDLGNKGFFGMHVSRKYGGLGLKTQDLLRVMEQIAAIDLSLATVFAESIQAAHTIEKYAKESLRTKYLPQLASGRILASGAMTEPTAGSNPRAMQATAIPDGKNSWLLKGHKRWVGLSSWAGIVAVYVNQMDSNQTWLGMSAFLVPQESPGLRIGVDSPTMGLRGFAKNAIHLEDVKVNSEQFLGKPGQGMEIAQDNMMYTRLCLAAANVGVLKRCAQLMLRYAERRTIATGKLLENPVTLVRLSELTAIIYALELLIKVVAELYDTDPARVPEEAYIVPKVLASEYLGWAADMLIQILGARGYEENNLASQIFRDARTFRIFEGPTEALNMYIGSRILAPNLSLEHFFSQHLKQQHLYDEIKLATQKVHQYAQSHKTTLFAEPSSIVYWSQALAGEIISYGLLVGAAAHNLEKNPSKENRRSYNWAHNKFKEVFQKAIQLSSAEASVVSSEELKELIISYTETIGEIEQTRMRDDISLDDLLKCNPSSEKNNSHSEAISEFEKLTKNPSGKSDYKKQNCPHNFYEEPLLAKLKYSKKINNDHCIHELFEAQVKRNPNAVAVIYQDSQLTYKELNDRANQLAHYLRKIEVGADKLVAIYMDRSLEMIISLLGVLKAGGAYLPLDHNYPIKRLKFMFEDSKAEIILTQKKLTRNLPFASKHVIAIDDTAELFSSEPDTNLPKNVKPDNLAYVIYTSGSTGKPKGVMQLHKALVNLISWEIEQVGGKRNILQFTSLSFDMSFMEIFSALCSGGSSVLISEKDRLDLFNFSKIIKKYAVEQLMISVAFLKELAAANLVTEDVNTLKEIITAGEQLLITPEIITFFSRIPNCRLKNYYGPSETHVVTAFELPHNPLEWSAYPPIGKPIRNVEVFILDYNLQLTGIDTPGEIYIGGLCLARGYTNDEKLTSAKFIQSPFSKRPEDKLYRTGDLGKYLTDGNIAFLGRLDDQVKIRGYRIELQEVESLLMQCSLIKEAVVIVEENEFADKHLIALVIPRGSKPGVTFIDNIRMYLIDHLPTHMVPAIFHLLEKLPLTPSGKIDRQALLKTKKLLTFHSKQLTEPKTENERILIDILQGFLKTRIGMNHSFISVGGNSLLAIQIVSKLHDVFGVEIPAFSLLSEPTIAAIAQRIDEQISLKSIVGSPNSN